MRILDEWIYIVYKNKGSWLIGADAACLVPTAAKIISMEMKAHRTGVCGPTALSCPCVPIQELCAIPQFRWQVAGRCFNQERVGQGGLLQSYPLNPLRAPPHISSLQQTVIYIQSANTQMCRLIFTCYLAETPPCLHVPCPPPLRLCPLRGEHH